MAATPANKILRVALVQGHKIVEERLFRKRQDVTVGQDAKATFVVRSLPRTEPAITPVIEHSPDGYALLFTEAMNGRVRVGAEDSELAQLRAQGAVERRGNVYVLPLPEDARGTVRLGDTTLLFQFTTARPEVVVPDVPLNVKGSIWRSMDSLFFAILAISLLINFSGATFIALSPKVEERELSLDELPDRFAKVLIPAKPPEPEKPPETQTAQADDKKAEKQSEKKDSKLPSDPVAKKAAIAQKVASKGLLKILGSSGGAGAFEDVLGGSTGAGDIGKALEGAGGVGVATADAVASGGARGGGTGTQAGIGDLGTSGGGNVNLGAKGDVKVTGHVKDAAPEVDSADVDRDALARYVKARLKAIQGCYERELKRNPSLKGKVQVRFAILPTGRTGEIDIEENTIGDEAVASCIRTVIRGWIFPFKPADEVPVSYPFVFSPAS